MISKMVSNVGITPAPQRMNISPEEHTVTSRAQKFSNNSSIYSAAPPALRKVVPKIAPKKVSKKNVIPKRISKPRTSQPKKIVEEPIYVSSRPRRVKKLVINDTDVDTNEFSEGTFVKVRVDK